MYTQALTESQATAVKRFIPISLQLQSCTSSNTYKRLYSCKRTFNVRLFGTNCAGTL